MQIIITEDLFREFSPIKEDTIVSKFFPYISLAQAIYIRPILGDALMDELEMQVEQATKGGEISPQNRALIREVAPVLAMYAVYQGLPYHWAAIVNKGITVRESENSKAVDISDIAQIRRWVLDDATVLASRLKAYLLRCKDSYPLWEVPLCGSSSSVSDTGVFIPKR